MRTALVTAALLALASAAPVHALDWAHLLVPADIAPSESSTSVDQIDPALEALEYRPAMLRAGVPIPALLSPDNNNALDGWVAMRALICSDVRHLSGQSDATAGPAQPAQQTICALDPVPNADPAFGALQPSPGSVAAVPTIQLPLGYGNLVGAFQYGWSSFMSQFQIGTVQDSLVIQAGDGNFATVLQQGNGNMSTIGQFGTDNVAVVRQD